MNIETYLADRRALLAATTSDREWRTKRPEGWENKGLDVADRALTVTEKDANTDWCAQARNDEERQLAVIAAAHVALEACDSLERGETWWKQLDAALAALAGETER